MENNGQIERETHLEMRLAKNENKRNEEMYIIKLNRDLRGKFCAFLWLGTQRKKREQIKKCNEYYFGKL